MPNIQFSEFVASELIEIATTIAADHPDAAVRFLEAADRTFELLAGQPHMGRERSFPHSRLKGMRSFVVSGFDNYLIFYQPIPEGIAVFHVYHGARNLSALFTDEI